MITTDGARYVFIRDPNDPLRLERREIVVARELRDRVIVSQGLQPGEVVISRGSLLVAQAYEDLQMTEAPPST